jgi:hypothetical protein
VSCRPLLTIQSLSQFLDISSGKRKRRVPWTQLQKALVDYIEPKYLPEQVTLKQYYHLSQVDVNSMLKHWTRRQAAGKVPFCFRKVAKATQENADTLEENDADADSDMGSGEEAEEYLQGDDVSQGAVQASEAADAYAHQQTGGDAAPDSPHTPRPHTHSWPHSLNHSLASGSQNGQTDETPAEDRQSESGSAGREPSLNDEVSNLGHHIGR